MDLNGCIIILPSCVLYQYVVVVKFMLYEYREYTDCDYRM